MKAKKVTFDGVELVIIKTDEPRKGVHYDVRVVHEYGLSKGFNYKHKTYMLGGAKDGNCEG